VLPDGDLARDVRLAIVAGCHRAKLVILKTNAWVAPCWGWGAL